MKLKHPKSYFDMTQEERKLFHANFEIGAYKKALEPVEKAMETSESFEELRNALRNYNPDVDYYDDFSIIRCEVILDKTNMKTLADYVGLCVYIEVYDNGKKPTINSVYLFSNEVCQEYVADLLCELKPETGEVFRWLYGTNILDEPHI